MTCHCSFPCREHIAGCACKLGGGLPQDQLRQLADTLEATGDPYYIHDIKLARHLADAIDRPRRDSTQVAIIETALHLIAEMQRHVETL